MKHFECRCGKVVVVAASAPCPCSGCATCGTVPANGDKRPLPAKPHKWNVLRVETDAGPQTVTRCVWCGVLKVDVGL